jgi:catalase
VMYDAVYVPGGKQSIEMLKTKGEAIHFVNEAFRHCKAIAATGEGVELLTNSEIQGVELKNGKFSSEKGVITSRDTSDFKKISQEFIEAIGWHRHWMREQKEMVPA